MTLKTQETLQRLFNKFINDSLGSLPPEQRERYQAEFQKRAEELIRAGADGAGTAAFSDLVGLGPKGAVPFDSLSMPDLQPDFDEAVIPTQLHAAAELYYIYQHERMKVFQVVGVLLKLFHDGRMRIQRGPGARQLYLIEKHYPLRYKMKDRMLAYRRAFNYGKQSAPTGAMVYTGFHRQFTAFSAAIAQYYRDLLIGEVIRGSALIDQRPFGSQATIQRLGIDMRWQLDRCTYGNIVPLTVETGNYLKTVLDTLETPDVMKAFDANTKWDVIEFVSQRYLGGIGQLTQRAKMADAGRRLLHFVADNNMREREFNLFQNEVVPVGPVAEEWIAAFRMTPEGRSFPGVTPALQSMLGVSTQPQAASGM
jgi:hypothetical protein